MWKPTQQYSGWVPPTSSDELWHSAKVSHWKNHKYLKKIGDTYVYAKKARAAKKKAKKYQKDFEKHLDENHLSDREVEPLVIARNEGSRRPTEKGKSSYYGPNSAYMQLPGEVGEGYRKYHDAKQDAADIYYQKQRQERIASDYDNLAKKKLKSLKDDIGSDLKNTFKKKKKKK